MSPKGLGEERGAVLLWMALMMVVFFAIAALAVDLGMGYAVKRQLSATADAASLAGAQEAGLKFKSTNGCPSGVPDPALVAAVNAAVVATHDANAPWGSTGAPTPTITCDSSQVTVAVTERSDLDTFFARAIGFTSISPAAAATANVFGSNFGGGLRPFTVCVEDAVAGAADVSATQQSVYRRHNAPTNPPTSGETLVEGGNTPWTESNDRIDPNKKMNLAVGDYVRLDVLSGADPATSGYYWVQDTPSNGKWITVSTTLGGSAVNITSNGVVDVYAQPTPISGGSSNWATNGTITAAAHGLAVDDQVWIAIRSGATGATSDYYFVTEVPSATTFKVSTTLGGATQTLTNSGSIDVYAVSAPSTPAASCQPTGSPGNWGYASFGLGGSQPVLKCLIDYGYGGAPGCLGTPTGTDLGDNDPSTPEVTAPGNTGNSIQSNPQFIPRLTALLDKTIVLPVAGTWSQNGSNANYSAKGGAAVQVCGFSFPKNNNDATPTPLLAGSCWDQSLYDAADAAGTLEAASLVLQWRYVREFTGLYAGQSSSSGDTCALGDPTCLPVVRLIG